MSLPNPPHIHPDITELERSKLAAFMKDLKIRQVSPECLAEIRKKDEVASYDSINGHQAHPLHYDDTNCVLVVCKDGEKAQRDYFYGKISYFPSPLQRQDQSEGNTELQRPNSNTFVFPKESLVQLGVMSPNFDIKTLPEKGAPLVTIGSIAPETSHTEAHDTTITTGGAELAPLIEPQGLLER